MSSYSWCHGPEGHTQKTQSRIRGSGDNKVLRTIKIGLGDTYRTRFPEYYIWQYFCNQSCLMDYIRLHLASIIAIAPRTKALETPIKVEVKTYDATDYPYYNGRKYKTITMVDNSNG